MELYPLRTTQGHKPSFEPRVRKMYSSVPLTGGPTTLSSATGLTSSGIPLPPVPYFTAPTLQTDGESTWSSAGPDKVCAFCSAHFIRSGTVPNYQDVITFSPYPDAGPLTNRSATEGFGTRSFATASSTSAVSVEVPPLEPHAGFPVPEYEDPNVPASPNAALRMMAEISCLPRAGFPHGDGVSVDLDGDLAAVPPICVFCSSYITADELKLLDETVKTLEGWRKTPKPAKRHRNSWDGSAPARTRRDSGTPERHTPKRAATSAAMHHSHDWSEVSGDSQAVKPSNDYGAQRFLRDHCDRHGLDAKILLDDVYTAAQHSHSKFKPNVDMDSYGTTGKYVLRKWAMAMIRATIEAVPLNKRVKKYTLDVPHSIADRLPETVRESGFKNKGAAAEYLVHDVLGLTQDFVPKVAENALTVERAYAILTRLYELNSHKFCVPGRREDGSDDSGHDD